MLTTGGGGGGGGGRDGDYSVDDAGDGGDGRTGRMLERYLLSTTEPHLHFKSNNDQVHIPSRKGRGTERGF